MAWRLNTPTIVYERFDDEMVLINLVTGSYYSLLASAADALACFLSGVSVGETLSQRYDASAEMLERSAQAFLEQLRAEAILVEGEMHPAPELPAPAEPRLPFTPPSLQTYTDMRDILLLDPIHDVDESGWPQPKQT